MQALLTLALLGAIIDHDTTFNLDNPPNPEESYSVVGDATLTFEAGTISYLELQDRVSLTGTHDIQLLSGKHQDYMIANNGYPGPDVNANIYVGPEFGLSTWFSFKGGHQEIVVDGFTYFDGQPRVFGPNVKATLHADDPFYHGYGDGILTGSYCDPKTCSALWVYYDVDWTILNNETVPDGDSDGNGAVDIVDLNLVRNNFGRLLYGSSLEHGDTYPLDGQVDITDLNRVRNNFGAVNPVPEPASSALVVAFLIIGFFCYIE
jgi:hypothetical protein